MKLKRTFQLTEYWDKFLEETSKIREELGSTESSFTDWDNTKWAFGGQSVTIPPETVSRFIGNIWLRDIYHHENLTLKIFYIAKLFLEAEMYECFWGQSNENEKGLLIETSNIQNLFAIGGLAPRVYDLVFLERDGIKYVAQVTDYVEGDNPFDELDENNVKKIYDFANKFCIEYGDIDQSNFKKGLFLDFQRFFFQPSYKIKLTQRIKEGLTFGSDLPYQSIEKLHIKGVRDNFPRYKIIREDFLKIRNKLPENFTALDFGCNGAFFLRRAFDWGATYGAGVDVETIVNTVRELMMYLGYFNVDLMTELPSKKFDVVFFLSMDLHYPFEKIVDSIGKLLYLEGHADGDHPPEKYFKMLKPHFSQVEHLGKTNDYGERNLFRAIK